MANYTRTQNEVVVASDATTPIPLTNFLPRQVYIRHLNKQVSKPGVPPFSPSIALQLRDWSNNRTSGLIKPTGRFDGLTPVFRPGTTTPVLAEVFASWTESPKGVLAHHMLKGELAVFEDYLGSSRQLSSGQVQQYTARDQPWATFIDHRTGLTAADGAAPTADTDGQLAVEFNRIIIRPVFNGGTSPTVDLTVWAREAVPGLPRGVWGVVGSVAGLADLTEAVFITGYREVFVQVTGVTGAPTSFVLQISGTSAS